MMRCRIGFSIFASYGEVCEAFGGRSYNFTTRCDGAQLALSLQEARQGDAAIARQEWRRLLRFARNDIYGWTSLHQDGAFSIMDSW